MLRFIVFGLLILASGNSAIADEAPLSAQQWHDNLQAIGEKYPRGATTAQSNLRRKQLIAEIVALEEVKVQMIAKVKEVRWKNGVAEVYTDSILPVRKSGEPALPLTVSRALPFELAMAEEEAAMIEPGTELSFSGTLVFHEGRYGAIGRTLKVQQMFTLRHDQLPGTPLGTYTSPDCTVTLGGKVYPSRWGKP